MYILWAKHIQEHVEWKKQLKKKEEEEEGKKQCMYATIYMLKFHLQYYPLQSITKSVVSHSFLSYLAPQHYAM